MKRLVFVVVVILLLLAGCTTATDYEETKPEQLEQWTIYTGGVYGIVTRFIDDEYGVACYMTGHGISCLQIQEEEARCR